MIKILLVEDHRIVREGIKSLLELNPEFVVIGEATNVDDAIDLQKKIKAGLIITDITLDNSNGIYLVKQSKILFPESKIIVLSMHNTIDYINESMDSGADAYMLKDCTKHELYLAISKIFDNQKYICKSSSQVLMNDNINTENSVEKNSKVDINDFDPLTIREMEILKEIAKGRINKEIAEDLNISVRTVDKHRFNILAKLRVNNTAELIRKATMLKMISI